MDSTPSKTTTLTSLALLKLQIDGGDDYFDYICPFIGQMFIEYRDTPLVAEEVREGISTNFGLEIPLDVIRFVLMRMRRKQCHPEISKTFPN